MQSYPKLLSLIESHIAENQFYGSPQNLYDPLNYILGLGGKRIRPVLTLMGCELYSGTAEEAIHAALAMEVFHNFTLIHDDIMDKAPLRRGNPTVHEKWDTPTAILSGDLMLAKAYECLLRSEPQSWSALFNLFNKTVYEVCEGQQMDMNFESQPLVSEAEYLEMIRLKTSVLLGCCLQTGAIIAGATESESRKVYNFGTDLGLGFQLMDDYLDAFGSAELVGKQTGGDILSGKKTIMMIHASKLEGEKLNKLLTNSELTDNQKIEEVKAIFVQTGADQYLKQKAGTYFNDASKIVSDLAVNADNKTAMLALLDAIKNRSF
jgi:geranylgeranyl diphosphate synthase type II